MPLDANTGLPVRSIQDADERLQTKIVDSIDVTRQAQVDADRNLHIEVHGNKPDGSDVVLALSELGRQNPDGFYVAGASGNTKPASVALVAHTRGATPGEADQVQRLTAAATGTIRALDVALRDENGIPFSQSNPLPTVLAEEADSDPVHDYKDSGGIVAAGTDNHDYVVPGGKLFLFKQVKGSSSGKGRLDILVNAVQVGTSRNSTSDPDYDWVLEQPIEVAAGVTVRVIATNQENQTKSTETTIVGKLIDV
jgi:hypothetical protein